MKIGFTSIFDNNNQNVISGTLYYMSHYLAKQGVEIIDINNLDKSLYKILKFKSFYYAIKKKKYLRHRDPVFIKRITSQIIKQIKITEPDVIFSQGSIEVSLLECNQPIVIWCDGIFPDLLNKHPHYKNLSNVTIRNSLMMEQKAYNNATLLLFPSEWAAQSAVENYKLNPSKVHVIPYGANIENELSFDEIKEKIIARSKDVIRILFSGVDWYYKGGDVLLDAVSLIKEKGFNVEVNIVGCNPVLSDEILKFTKVHGYLNKANERDNILLMDLYTNSHFFVLPTRYEMYGISFCEANAYGLPAFGTNTGGVSSIIKNGINGYLIEKENQAEFIANKIIKLFTYYDEYLNLSISSYNEYKIRLNWDVSCQKFLSLIQNHKTK